MSKAAKLAYTPVGIVGGIVAGSISSSIFTKVWSRVRGDEVAPNARTQGAGWKEIVLASALQGAIFAAVSNGVDHAGAVAFSRWAGAWPGDDPVEKIDAADKA
jgi:hypothetical protein